MPEIGFIVTTPSRALTCASGLAPTATWPGVTIAKVQYAPRSCSSSARNQVSAAVAASASTPAVKSRRMTKFAPSPRPISSAMTRRTIVGVLVVGDVEAGVGERDRRGRQLRERLARGR